MWIRADPDRRGIVWHHGAKGDIELLEMVQNPIAFNPNTDLFEYAKSKNWKIVIERKNVIFELEKQDGKYILTDTKS
jgi:hypothetical protein